MYRNCVKRALAIVLSLVSILTLGWLLILLSIAIKLDSPGPVLFRQKRVGLGKSHFYILKFRTMRIDTPRDMPTHLLVNPEQYITRVGRFLRKTSLDELPQLFNILRHPVQISTLYIFELSERLPMVRILCHTDSGRKGIAKTPRTNT